MDRVIKMSQEESTRDGQGGLLVERQTKAQRPSLYRVLLLNDDYTPMEFVVEILEKVFHRDHAAATAIMLEVHKRGVGECGIYPYEIAETKVARVMRQARDHDYPLQCTLEKAE